MFKKKPMKKIASIYLNVLLILTSLGLFATLGFTLVVGHSPYEAIGMDPGLGAMITLGGCAMLFCVPHFLNRDFTSRRPSRSLIVRRGRKAAKPRLQ
jgi:hypothetical protein